MAVSVGLMNLLSCPFGGMPVCRGSGGLAAQYRFGARSGLSTVMLGSAKLLAGLLFGSAAAAWMLAFPSSVLAVVLLTAGAALARASSCWDTKVSLTIACVMVTAHMASGLLPLGFAAGWIAWILLARRDSRVRPTSRRLAATLAAPDQHAEPLNVALGS
jgi:MFS superfamily sulfate permease-like transporter